MSTAAPALVLECLWNSGLLQHSVGSVARQDFMVYREFALCDWAEPDFMVALACAVETTAVLAEDFLDFGRVVRHQAATESVVLSSPWY